MNILGTVYLVDEPHIDILKANLSMNPPPGGRVATGTMICMDMDETDNMLELRFPDHCQKATLLCPPPIAMYKEIDGDMEGFIQEYNNYLENEDSVQDFLASMILFLHIGGNILLYTPSHLDDDALWLHTLVMFFYTRFGITVGGPSSPASYDPTYDGVIPEFLYSRGVMEVFDYIYSCTGLSSSPFVQNRLVMDLLPYVAPGENPLDFFTMMKMAQANGCPPQRPAITFDR